MHNQLFVFFHKCQAKQGTILPLFFPCFLSLPKRLPNTIMESSCVSLSNYSTSFFNTLFCITLCILWSLPLTTALTLGYETDRLALLALKKQLTDGSPGSLPSWNESLSFCEWQGVQCGRRHRRVTHIIVYSQKLKGSLSPSIGNLTFLREITLFDNKLRGEIPKEIGLLRRLQFLNLAQNNFQGKIPLELTNCSSLQVIIFTYNNLTGEILSQLGSLLQLTRLSLTGNRLVGGIPSSLGNLSFLSTLALAANNLEGNFPQSLSRLSMLQYLTVYSNNLSGTIHPSLYNLSAIQELDVGGNHFKGNLIPNIDLAFPNLLSFYLSENQFTGTIPTSVANISGLQSFEIFQNYFTGSVPGNLGNLKNLQNLNVGFNLLGGGAGDLNFLNSLTNCSQLEALVMHINKFGGVVPDSIGNLSIQLNQLYMGRNQISGHIPESIGNLAGLTVLDMGINLLEGTIPNSIGKLQNLSRLFLHRNNISGGIPSTIGNLSKLFDLFLHTNKLNGNIPMALGFCTGMQNMYLFANSLSGEIPDKLFGLLKNLIVLNVSRNSFTGSLPSDTGKMKNLVVLDVSQNKFSSGIPTELGACSSLEQLQMEKNVFQGNIPLTLSNLKAIQSIDLSQNNLSGTIPKELGSLAVLTRLNLSFNQLDGAVPTNGVFRNMSAISITGNSKLCGGIPGLQLPVCINQETKKKNNKVLILVIVAVVITILILSTVTVILLLFWRRKKHLKKLDSASLLGDGYMRVTYKDLLEGTNGFASSNLIGVGSFGSVYKGILPPDERPVAVKVLNLENRGASKSFMAECKALRKIRHRNLLKIITACSTVDYKGNDFKALVYEFMPNGSLENWLHTSAQHESTKLTLKQRIDIALDVAYALDYLHHQCGTPIIHCDLKPSNILLDDDMVARVGDFGLAKLISRASGNFSKDLTGSAAVKGTIGYVAPEYGMGSAISPQGDMYSYGILLLEMITAKRPTDDEFKVGTSLHNFCEMALSERVEEIIDSSLLEEFGESIKSIEDQQDLETAWLDCLVSIVRVGVACSVEYPGERMDIQSVIRELRIIKERLLR